MIITFLAITAGLFALVFFTPGSDAPKLGIDLQGGTRVTLTARTSDGSTPSNDSMKQARDVMERRVNGSGVVGAQVQIDGSRQLVITVPGQDNLEGLTRSAQLNIRPVVTQWVNPDVMPAVATTESSLEATDTTGPAETGTPGVDATGAEGGDSTEDSAEPTSDAPSTSETSQGLRAGSPALLPREVTGDNAATSTEASAPATTDSSAPATTSAPSTTVDPDAPPVSAFPAGSDPAVPLQPAGSDEAAFQAWQAEISSYLQTPGTGPTCQQINYFQGLDDPDKPILSCDEEGVYIYLLEPTLIPGTEIKDATSGIDAQGGQGWVINVDFKSDGFKTWSAYTTGHVGTQTAFTLDGQVLSAPSIRQPITTPGTQVSGSFTQQSAKSLADSLKFGALPLAFDRSESQQVSAELGFQYLKAGLIAGGIGLVLVVIYCLVYYRLLGIITILSLLLSGALVYAVMVLLGRWIGLSLDMAGIAGLIISIGITADSFVVYFERIKDEVREGRTFRSSVPRGWVRAKKTILSADAVTLLSAAILYILAVGDVKGFAFTLGLSTTLDLLVVFLVTHPLVALLSKSDIFAHPVWSGLGSVAKAGAEHRAATAQLQATEA